MAELWQSSSLAVKDPHPSHGVFAMRVTNCQTGDTITLPCKNIDCAVVSDETTANVALGAIASNALTITCTNDDEIDVIAVVTY